MLATITRHAISREALLDNTGFFVCRSSRIQN